MLGAYHAVNAYGKAAGLTQLAELGTIESPHPAHEHAGGRARCGREACATCSTRIPDAARDRDTVNVIVGECFDGWLSDARALAVRPEHALEAIAAASADETARARWAPARARPASASSRASGTSSRAVGGHTLGCLVVSNYGARATCTCWSARTWSCPARTPEPPAQGGSIMIVAGHRRAALRAPAAAPGATRDVRPGTRGQLRRERERGVRDRVLDRAPGRAPGGARHATSSPSCATTRPRCATCSRPRARWCWSRS